MELCTGGEVFDRIVEKENYSETEARVAVRQVVEAIKVCHDHGIVHREESRAFHFSGPKEKRTTRKGPHAERPVYSQR